MTKKFDITTTIKAIITCAIGELGNYEITTNTTARSSHGRTTSTSTTSITRKPAVAEPKKKHELLVAPKGWEPVFGKPEKGYLEDWGVPRWDPKTADYLVKVTRAVPGPTGATAFEEYDMLLKSTLRMVIGNSARRMRQEATLGKAVFVPLPIQKTRELAEANPKLRIGDIVLEINELYDELNDLVVYAARHRGEVQPYKKG